MTDTFTDDNPGGINWDDTEPIFSADDGRLPFTPDEPFTTGGDDLATADPAILKKHRRANGAKGYEDKVNDILTMAVAYTAPNPATVADAAAILLHGERISYTLGDLAVTDVKVASAINFLSGGTGNPTVAVATAVAPFILQLVRNHEPQLESITKISVPFTKGRIGFKVPTRFKIKLGRAKAMTNDPGDLYQHAFYSDPSVLTKLTEKGIKVAAYSPRHRSD